MASTLSFIQRAATVAGLTGVGALTGYVTTDEGASRSLGFWYHAVRILLPWYFPLPACSSARASRGWSEEERLRKQYNSRITGEKGLKRVKLRSRVCKTGILRRNSDV
jgi:hypothetical protein